MALSAALRTGESFGAGHLVDILTGTPTDKVRQRGHDRLPTFGIGKAWSARDWQAILRQMMGRDLLRPDPERHGALRLTDRARPILRGEQTLTLRQDRMTPAPSAGTTGSAPRVRALVSGDDAPLLAALKACRRALAEAAGAPAYIIFTDRTLIEMAETRPATLDAMARINGVGAKKLASYGQAFLDVINGAAPPVHPARQRLAATGQGGLYDRLLAAQAALARGEAGTDKPMRLSAAELARIAERRPRDLAGLARLIGDRAADRFGPAFLSVLAEDA
jgi:ATP-dependent DNA helicase RecQ